MAITGTLLPAPSGTPGDIQPDDAAAEGTEAAFARTDHQHQIIAAIPSELAGVQAAAEGVATTFARADHGHQIQPSIADDHIVTMDDSGPAASGEHARFTANGLEGLTGAQLWAALSGQATAAVSMNSQNITDLASAQDPNDAVSLDDILDHIGITLNYWLGNQILTETLTDSEAVLQETPSSTLETLSTITFKSTVADTPTPFEIKAGATIEFHFDADETGGAGRNVGLHCVFGYVDSNGTSNFIQIGADSDSTGELTTAKTSYILHSHVGNNTEVPVGKRLWLKFVSTSLSGGGGYPEINVYYDDPKHHVVFGVAGSILANFVQKSLFDAKQMSYSITVKDPGNAEDITIAFTNRAITITEIRAVLVGSATPSVTWKIRHHATDRNNVGNAVVTAGTTTTSTTAGSDVTAFDDATIPADSFIWFETTAKSGTVTELHITIVYTVD